MKKNIRKISLLCFLFLCFVIAFAFSACGTKEPLKYEYSEKYDIYLATVTDTKISGSIVVPAKYNDKDVSLFNSIFKDCTELTSITISEGITSIPNNAFKNCHPEVINLPSTITYFGDQAFDHTFSYNINFAGTKGQWRTQIKGYSLYSGKVTCSDGEITIVKNEEQK